MRIFITGATGFLGSYLAEDLVAHGHQVSALLRPNTDPWRLSSILDRLHVVSGALDDLDRLRGALTALEPEAVVHLAWRGVGNADRKSPGQARNVSEAVDLAALAAEAGATAFIGAGSQAEYGPYDRVIRESDAPRPTTLYGAAKLAAGSMTGLLAAERAMRFAWLRIFSTYGPKDADYWLIPTMIRTLKNGERMPLTGCEQRWGFLHARDAASAFARVITDPTAAGVFNVGSPDAPPLRQTVETLRDLVDPKAELGFGDVPYRPDQVMTLQADIARLSALGWKPEIGLEEGLRETVAWYADANDLDPTLFARRIRAHALRMVHKAKSSHIGSCLSAADVIAVLYARVLRVDPTDPTDPARDRFVFSKGHAAAILYAALAERGFFPVVDLGSFCEPASPLTGHVSHSVPGIEVSTGSLGHGLPVAIGMALAAKAEKRGSRVFCMLSDGECDEGSNWEAILFAPHHKLDNLVVIVDYNRIQSFGRVSDVLELEPFAEKWRAFGWQAIEVDGHDRDALERAFARLPVAADRPTVVIAHTIKGKGVSFMEDRLEWHYKSPTDDQLRQALAEIDA